MIRRIWVWGFNGDRDRDIGDGNENSDDIVMIMAANVTCRVADES